VQKRAHVTRFNGASLVADQVAWSSSDLDPYDYVLKFRQENGEIKLDAPPPKRSPATHVPETPPTLADVARLQRKLELSPHEIPIMLAFDPQSQEGLASVLVGETTHLRRFDAAGKWIGAPLPSIPNNALPIAALAHHGGQWFGMIDGAHKLRNLTKAISFDLPPSGWRPADLHVRDGSLHVISPNDTELLDQKVTTDGVAVGDPISLGTVPAGTYPSAVQVFHPAGLPPMLVVGSTGSEEDTALHWRPVTVGARWKKINPFHGKFRDANLLKFREIHGDVVAVYTNEKRTTVTWLNAGKQEQFDAPDGLEDEGGLRDLNLTSYLSSAEGKAPSFLPAEPGAPVVVEGLGAVEKECNAAVSTAPGVVVFLCAQALDEKKPGFRAGLRVLKMAP
jgi:hypothetical protein